MRQLILISVLLGAFVAFGPTQASAFACAPGVYWPGCVEPQRGLMRHHHYNGGVYPGGIYRGGVYPGGVYPGSRGGVSRNIGPNQITPGGATIPGGR